MNTTQIKRFAQDVRKKLITLVGGKLEAVLTQDSAALRAKTDTINKLNNEIKSIGKEALIDKVAYIWFNRLVALRFMDANDFQPLGINVLSPAQGTSSTSPQILSDIQAGVFPEDLPLDRKYINNVLSGVTTSNNPDNDIFRHILIAVCNDLHRIFPFLFERIDDYTELLLPDDLTSPFSIIADVVNGMSVSDCLEVEIIGWLYQFYISEKKDEVFASKSRVKKEDIPAATQLFTPRWIVEYMIQNTVGKLWVQNNPTSNLRNYMPYYIESPSENTIDYLKIDSVEEIKLLDQACGSGHILVYGFELLTKIYEEQGYSTSDIPALIIEKNLYGLEIDERAAQLAAFAIIMKARQYYRRFFRKVATPNIICYEDITLSVDEIDTIIDYYNIKNEDAFKADLKLLEQATNLGSLIQPHTDLTTLEKLNNQLKLEIGSSDLFWQQTQNKLFSAVNQLTPLARKYHCVVDNPPYMGGGNMNPALSDFVKSNYPKSKADLMACFMEAGISILYPKGFMGMINQRSWMFLNSYEELREQLVDTIHIDTLLYLGPKTFPEIGGEVVQNVAFTLVDTKSKSKGTYIRLTAFDSSKLKKQKALEAIHNPNCSWFYNVYQKDFEKIRGIPFGFWLSVKEKEVLSRAIFFDEISRPCTGMQSGANPEFVRYWTEVGHGKIGNYEKSFKKKWCRYQMGGESVKWTGNPNMIILWENDGEKVQNHKSSVIRNKSLFGKKGISWKRISSSDNKLKLLPEGMIFDQSADSLFPLDNNNFLYIFGYSNSKVMGEYFNLFSPTLNLTSGSVEKLPIYIDSNSLIDNLTLSCITISNDFQSKKEDHIYFNKNELIRLKSESVYMAINNYKSYWTSQFWILHQNEEELNRLFIEIYGLQSELTPDIPIGEITILKEELSQRKLKKIKDSEEESEDSGWTPQWEHLEQSFRQNGCELTELPFNYKELIAQLISYAVGCIFGRYSLDKEGLILANQGETFTDYLNKVEKAKEELLFVPDEDNVVPILEEEWFDDDIVSRIKEFIRAVWGEASYSDNIHYIEDVLGKDLRKYLTKDFYKDHIKRYKKRPIYWMFSSAKGHFNVLIYMHRYTPDTLNYILNSYLRPFMEKVRNELQRQEDIIISGSVTEQGKARKRQDNLKDILKDCEAYEYEILYPLAGERIEIDLDDGVLVNYNKFGNAIAPVLGLNDTKTKKKVKTFDWIDTSTIR